MDQSSQNVTPHGAGAQAGGLATERPAVCRKVRQQIEDMRSDMYLALTLEEFAKHINEAEEDGAITVDDVKTCIKHDATVKIIETDGKEVLWLWDDWYMNMLMNEIAKLAVRYKEVLTWVRDD
jgi:hypothetical protein